MRAWQLFLAWPFAMLMLIGASGWQGVLVHPLGWSAVLMDVVTVVHRVEGALTALGMTRLATILASLDINGSSAPADAYFPLLRDYPSLILVFLLSTNLALIYKQWHVLHDFAENLSQRPLIQVRAANLAPGTLALESAKLEIAGRFMKQADALARIGNRNVRYLLAAVLLVLFLVFAYSESGMLQALSPPGLLPQDARAWSLDAYDQWWASFETHKIGWLLYSAIATVGVYYIILQNVVGLRYVWPFFVIRRKVEYAVQLQNPDQWYGWKPLRDALTTVFASILLHAIALSVLMMAIPVREFWWLTPLFAIFVICNPLFVIVPLVLVRGALRDCKTRLEDDARGANPLPSSFGGDGARLGSRLAIAEELARIRAIPSIPFRPGRLGAYMITYMVPMVTTIVQVAAALRR